MEIRSAEFTVSASRGNVPDYGRPEIAVAGGSNVGKSSFINYVGGSGKLARVSKDPGRTRLINFYRINGGEFYLVDLPGYGYAEAPKKEKSTWGAMMEEYLLRSRNLLHVFLLTDIRRGPSALDLRMADYLSYYKIPFSAVATKSDKLGASETRRALERIAAGLGTDPGQVIPVSSLKRTGREEILEKTARILENPSGQF